MTHARVRRRRRGRWAASCQPVRFERPLGVLGCRNAVPSGHSGRGHEAAQCHHSTLRGPYGLYGASKRPEFGQTGAHKASNGASSVGRLHEGPQMIIDLERTDDRASWWLLLAGRCWLLALGVKLAAGAQPIESSFFFESRPAGQLRRAFLPLDRGVKSGDTRLSPTVSIRAADRPRSHRRAHSWGHPPSESSRPHAGLEGRELGAALTQSMDFGLKGAHWVRFGHPACPAPAAGRPGCVG